MNYSAYSTHMPSLDSKSALLILDEADQRLSYGGNQAWFARNTQACAGCGSVAVANMLLCLQSKYSGITPASLSFEKDEVEKAENIISFSIKPGLCTKKYYLDLMNNIYQTMKTFEIPVLHRIYDHCHRNNRFFKKIPPNGGSSICGFLKGVLKYAQRREIFLHSHTLPTVFCSCEEGLRFIKEGLAQAGCVVLLTAFNRHPLTLFGGACAELKKPFTAAQGMRNHFATITNILYPENPQYSSCLLPGETANGPILLLSTWGRIAAVNYCSLAESWQSRKACTSCLFYFTPAGNPEDTKQDIKNACKVLYRAIMQALIKKPY